MDIFISISRGIIGIIVLLVIAFIFSNNKRKIKWRIIISALIINLILVNFILHTSIGKIVFELAAKGVDKFMSYSAYGASFIFGTIQTGNPFSFIFIALVPLIFLGAFMAILYHYGIVQYVIKFLSLFLMKILKLSGLESFGICSNVLMGQTETAVIIGPYLPKLSQAELFMVMTSGMSSVAGSLLYAYEKMGANLSFVIAASLLSAPSAVITAKILFPEISSSENVVKHDIESLNIETKNIFDAISHGAMNGWKVALGVGVMLIAFIPLVHVMDSLIHLVTFKTLTFNSLLGYIFTPLAYLIGVPSSDVMSFSTLLGQKTLFNEFVAYSNISKFHFSDKGFLMMCFVLTGFANLGSIAVQIGAFGSQSPLVKNRVVKFGLKALLGGILANLISATMAGMFFFE
jgi:concentrative nucleoside transporter, CNT family